MLPVIDIQPGDAPLIVNVPHDGREIPADIGATMTAEALALPDTDWHIRDLYAFAAELGATITSARYSRYVVDLNRDPSGKSLYPGADTTEVCPTSTFHREPIYREGQEPDAAEIDRRLGLYWRSYHTELARVIAEQRDRHGTVLLFDAHSIGSELPRFFEGRLPDFNLGTADGASADTDLTNSMFDVLDSADGYAAILNGRFKGGYITRHYGNPDGGVHAIQLEMAQVAYMDENAPYRFRPDLADRVRPVLRNLLSTGLDWARDQGRTG
ncbi:MAG: N-formylglutamate deformylase [Alphaproteobacteria bacterium]